MTTEAASRSATEPKPELLAWDSEFWGFRVGRTNAPDVDAWAIENSVDLMCLLTDADSPDVAQRAEEQGFRFMDVRVTLARTTARHSNTLREHCAEDVDLLATIAQSAHVITRFYADPRLSDARCDEFYETWLRKSCAGWADKVLVAEHNGLPAGFVTVNIDEREATASIGLIAVAEGSRGVGLGAELVRGAAGYGHAAEVGVITVVTQGRNVAAQRLFQSCGFVTVSTELWFHKWMDQRVPQI